MTLTVPNAQIASFPGQAVDDQTDWAIDQAALAGNGVVSGCGVSALSLSVTGASNTGTAVTLDFTTGPTLPTSASITVAGCTGTWTSVNGTWTVTSATATSVTFTVSSAPTGSISGTVTITGMVVLCAAGSLDIAGTNYTPSATYVAITAASQTDRRDLIVYTVGTGFTVANGTPNLVANYPVKPSVPASSIGTGEVYVCGPYGTGTATTALATANIVDKTAIIGATTSFGSTAQSIGTSAGGSAASASHSDHVHNVSVGSVMMAASAYVVTTSFATITDGTTPQSKSFTPGVYLINAGYNVEPSGSFTSSVGIKATTSGGSAALAGQYTAEGVMSGAANTGVQFALCFVLTVTATTTLNMQAICTVATHGDIVSTTGVNALPNCSGFTWTQTG